MVRLRTTSNEQTEQNAGNVLAPKRNLFLPVLRRLAPLQAQNADKKLAQTMYLPLAEKMIEKHIEKGKIEAEAGESGAVFA